MKIDQDGSEAFNLSEMWTCVYVAPWLLWLVLVILREGRLSSRMLCDLETHSSLVFPFIPEHRVQDRGR